MTKAADRDAVDLKRSSEQWIANRLAANRITPATARAYRTALKSFTAHPEVPAQVENVRSAHVEAWLVSMEGRTESTQYARLSAIAAFFDWAHKHDHIPVNPVAKVERPKLIKGEPRPVKVSEARLVLAKAPLRVRVMILLAVEMGLRRGEIAQLRVLDFDFEDGSVLVKGKGKRERQVTISRGVGREVTLWIAAERLQPADWLFPSPKHEGRHLSVQRVGDLITEAGAKVFGYPDDREDRLTAHRYRHRAGTDIARRDGIHAAKAVLGHASVATTEIYAKLGSEQVRAALQDRDYLAEPDDKRLDTHPEQDAG